MLTWHRKLTARKWDYSNRRRRVGRPPSSAALKRLILRLALENPRWGQRRIQGEMARLGHPIASGTVWNLLHAAGIDPAPRRYAPSWTQFLTAQAQGIVAADFFHLDTAQGQRLYTMAFLEHGSRRLHLTPARATPRARGRGVHRPHLRHPTTGSPTSPPSPPGRERPMSPLRIPPRTGARGPCSRGRTRAPASHSRRHCGAVRRSGRGPAGPVRQRPGRRAGPGRGSAVDTLNEGDTDTQQARPPGGAGHRRLPAPVMVSHVPEYGVQAAAECPRSPRRCPRLWPCRDSP
jgi:hypothetical protein